MSFRVVNYDGGIVATPQRLVQPESVADIQAILRDRARYPGPVRAVGSYHSLTPCASSDGTMIDMRRLSRVLSIDLERRTFTAQAGLPWIAASRFLRSVGMQFFTNIEIGNMTLGSAACCQTKDGLDGVEFGQVNSYVTAIKWVAPDGSLREASAESDPSLLRFVRSSYGLCGVVCEVTFRIKPLEAVLFTYRLRPAADLQPAEVEDFIARAEGLVCWTIGRSAVFQTRTRVARVGFGGPRYAAMRRSLWNRWEALAGRAIDRYVPTQRLRDLVLDGWFAGNRTVFRILQGIGGATLLDPDKTVDYSRTPESAKYAFTFWTFPRARWLDVYRKYLAFADAYRSRTAFRCNMPFGSYFIRKDTGSLLSYSHDGDTFSVDPIHAYTDRDAWRAFLEAFNDFASGEGGIPLLNQSPFVTKAQVQRAYGERWSEFAAWVRREDPDGRMLNPFFAALL